MKIGKYIIEIVPNKSYGFELCLPYNNNISFNPKSDYDTTIVANSIITLIKRDFIKCKHIKPNTGIRYSILGKYWIFLVIKQLN